MTNLTGNHGSLFSRTPATGLALLLFLSLLPACAARHMPDWSRVQAVPPKTKTDVQLYKDDAPQGSRKMIQGRFDSATTDSLTLTLKDGQTRTLQKQAVRKVLTRRPFSKRWPGWVALGVTAALVEILLAPPSHDIAMPRLGHVIFTLPIPAAFFYGSRMEGIYEVPPKHRARTQGVGQSDTQGKAPEKPKDHPRRD